MMMSATSRIRSGSTVMLSWERRWSYSVTGEERNVSNDGFSTASAVGLL